MVRRKGADAAFAAGRLCSAWESPVTGGKGSDDTLFALVDGTVRFERVGKSGKKCSVKQ